MDIKMIATDLDHTLLRTDKTISDYTANVLRTCRLQGIKIVIATARAESECVLYEKILNPDAVITNRGANIRVGNNTIYSAVIDSETTNRILQKCTQHPDVKHITVFTEKGYFGNIKREDFDPSWGEYKPEMYNDFAQGMVYDTYKITVNILNSTAADTLEASFPMVDLVRFTGDPWVSFTKKHVNKWEGVKQVAAHFNIDTKDIAAFGDDYSDIEMLKECGTGVAVENAIQEVRAVSDHICKHHDADGVAKWIEENILNKGESPCHINNLT